MGKNENKLIHVAFIMDGNGRWAKARGLPRHLGHKAGCDRIIDIYKERFANAGDFEFYLVGDLNADSVAPMLAK